MPAEDAPPASLPRSFSNTTVLPPRLTLAQEEAEACRIRQIYEQRDPFQNADLMHFIRTGQHSDRMLARPLTKRVSLERVARPYKWHAPTEEVTYEEGGTSPLQKSWMLPPIAQRPELIRRAHQLGHFGISATVYRIRDLPIGAAYWPGMQVDVANFVRECATCLQYSNAPPMQPLATASQVPGIFDEVAIDLLTGLPQTTTGYTGIFVITEYLSRFPFAYPIRGKTAEEAAACLMHYIALFGAPRVIRSDNGGEFVNKLVDALFTSFGIHRKLTTAYHPRSNGAVERLNRTLLGALSKMAHSQPLEWPNFLNYVLMAYRTTPHPAILGGTTTPFELVFGRPSNPLIDYSTSPSVEGSLVQSLLDRTHQIRRMVEISIPLAVQRQALVRNRQRAVQDATHAAQLQPPRLTKDTVVIAGRGGQRKIRPVGFSKK